MIYSISLESTRLLNPRKIFLHWVDSLFFLHIIYFSFLNINLLNYLVVVITYG